MDNETNWQRCRLRRERTNAAVKKLLSRKGKCLLLIVDDIEEVLVVFRLFLEKDGYEVHSAVNGVEALRLAKTLRPDLILLNYMMPVMDGLTALTTLKGDPIISYLKVVMHSALSSSASFRTAALEAGAIECLQIPFDRATLMKAVHKALRDDRR